MGEFEVKYVEVFCLAGLIKWKYGSNRSRMNSSVDLAELMGHVPVKIINVKVSTYLFLE